MPTRQDETYNSTLYNPLSVFKAKIETKILTPICKAFTFELATVEENPSSSKFNECDIAIHASYK